MHYLQAVLVINYYSKPIFISFEEKIYIPTTKDLCSVPQYNVHVTPDQTEAPVVTS